MTIDPRANLKWPDTASTGTTKSSRHEFALPTSLPQRNTMHALPPIDVLTSKSKHLAIFMPPKREQQMDDATREENEQFENDVRRIAKELWPNSDSDGAQKIDGRERDGCFETEECIHLLEATTSRKQAKADGDIRKLLELAAKLRKKNTTKSVKCWFVTRDEPTADQRQCAEKVRDQVNVLSYASFQSRLIDTHKYLELRTRHTFGSARDPATNAGQPAIDYVDLHMSGTGDTELSTADDLVNAIADGQRICILGDYGTGKSMTLRHIFMKLRARHLRGVTPLFPVYLNLRDHQGQTDPVEILARHAFSIGLDNRSHLVRAWRAGFAILLLDGFDELTPVNVQGLWKRLHDNRYRTMEPVRRLLKEHPAGVGLAISGRAHFFDSATERQNAISTGTVIKDYSLCEFTEEQTEMYLNRCGYAGAVPSWLPTRPLLVAYLASRGFIAEIASKGENDVAVIDEPEGWNFLLDKVSSREADMEAGIDGSTVRRILERLATKARAFQGGRGPLVTDSIIAAFTEICGYPPDERGINLLQRLPGLGIDEGEIETRSFIDEGFVDACRSGDVLEFIEDPYDGESPLFGPLECDIGDIAIGCAGIGIKSRAIVSGKISSAITRSQFLGESRITSDLVRIAIANDVPIEGAAYIRDLCLNCVTVSGTASTSERVTFQDCLINRLEIDSDVPDTAFPNFVRCCFGSVDGRISAKDLPPTRFSECEFEAFELEVGTTNLVLELDVPLGVRVLITVLKKLFERRGSGRKANALSRGLDHRARRVVPSVLKLLQGDGIAVPVKRGGSTIWIADRASRKRVAKIVSAPSTSEDPLVCAVRMFDS